MQFPAFDANKTIVNIFTKLFPNNADGKGLAVLLQALYRVNPKCVKLTHGIHNNTDGTETYISLRIYNDATHWSNAHVYGSLRGSRFNVHYMELFMFGHKHVLDYRRAEDVASVPSESETGW